MRRTTVAFLGLLIVLVASPFAFADNDRYARLRYIEGEVALYPNDNDRPTEATINSPLLDGDEIETQNGRAEISYKNGIVVRMGDYSAVRMESSYSPMILDLIQGTVFVDSNMVNSLGDELEVRA